MTVRDVAAIFTIWLEVVARFCQPSIYSIVSMVGAFFFSTLSRFGLISFGFVINSFAALHLITLP